MEKEKNKSHLLLRRIHELESLNGLGQSSSLAGISTTAVAGSTVIKSPPNTAVTFNKQSQLENADAEAQNAIKQLRDKVGQLTRKWEEERTQTHLLKQELRQTQRALVLETGDEEITLQKV